MLSHLTQFAVTIIQRRFCPADTYAIVRRRYDTTFALLLGFFCSETSQYPATMIQRSLRFFCLIHHNTLSLQYNIRFVSSV